MNYAEMFPREAEKRMPRQTLGEANLEQKVELNSPDLVADPTQLLQQ